MTTYSERDRRGYDRAPRYASRTYDRGVSSRYWESSSSARRDPREPVTYKDLDAPEDIY